MRPLRVISAILCGGLRLRHSLCPGFGRCPVPGEYRGDDLPGAGNGAPHPLIQAYCWCAVWGVMNTSILRPARLLAGGASLILVLAAAASSPHAAVTGIPGFLSAVSFSSSSDGWAVGYQCVSGCGTTSQVDHTLTLHWNGTAWAKVPSPSLGPFPFLTSVYTRSPSDAWAVGWYSSNGFRTLILHWNGTKWAQVPSPSPEVTDGSFLQGVTAVSASDAWAVGWFYGYGGENSWTLILHWNGTTWTRLPSPNPAFRGFNVLAGVTGVSASDAWAVGGDDNGNLIAHWNGTRWKKVASPQVTSSSFGGVSATSASDAWAVGNSSISFSFVNGTVAAHWNGTTWARVPIPSPPGAFVDGVSADSPADAWAVGSYVTSSNVGKALILRWHGGSWARVASPNPGGTSGTALNSVSALSPSEAWAVGGTTPPGGAGGTTVILRWNGTSWTRS